MYRIDNATAVVSRPAATAAGTAGWFTDGTVGVTPATIVPAEFLNMIQAEIVSVLTAASITPDKTASNQLLLSIQALITDSIIDTVYPVGITIGFATTINPNTEWPSTTWVRDDEGKFPVGYKSGDADFGTLGGTGGAKLLDLTMSLETRTSSAGGAAPPYSTTITTDNTFSGWVNTGDALSATDVDLRLKFNAANTFSPFKVKAFWTRTA